MEEKKLTDEEIAKAILQQIEYNAGIPYINEWQQVKTIKFTDILDFITRLKGSIEGLTAENKVVHNENDELIAKVERLKINLANEKKWGKIQAKEAVKDTANKVYKGLCERKNWDDMKDAILWGNESEELKALISKIVGVEVE